VGRAVSIASTGSLRSSASRSFSAGRRSVARCTIHTDERAAAPVVPPPRGHRRCRRASRSGSDGDKMPIVSSDEIDDYLGTLDQPTRATLAQLRDTIAAIVPEAEQCISYGMPAFKLRGKTIAGFAAFKHHLSYLPHSGRVIPLVKETAGYTTTKGSLHFAVDEPLPKTLVKKLLDARIAEAFSPRRQESTGG
jgi:uncharacterized protein YdhG (YjbR/CyaY superfamily)